MSGRCVVICGAPIDFDARNMIREGDYVMCADSGWQKAREMGIVPDMIVGDFDSSPDPSDRYDNVEVLPTVKDDTDTHHIARHIIEKGFTDVLLLGAVGGNRIEHTLSNISTMLFLAEHGISATARTGKSTLIVIKNGKICLKDADRRFLSVFPLGDRSEGVTITGAKYEVEDAVLTNDFPIGVSNEFIGNDVTIEVEKGSLLIVITDRDDIN
ncbi:MAG: thiamine diphosphokinase [Oscillospiraceae bacterium]|nr:thiamine diphosphokinase [Oscillospiraceae bacterium]